MLSIFELLNELFYPSNFSIGLSRFLGHLVDSQLNTTHYFILQNYFIVVANYFSYLIDSIFLYFVHLLLYFFVILKLLEKIIDFVFWLVQDENNVLNLSRVLQGIKILPQKLTKFMVFISLQTVFQIILHSSSLLDDFINFWTELCQSNVDRFFIVEKLVHNVEILQINFVKPGLVVFDEIVEVQ